MRKGGYSATAWKVIPDERNTVELGHWVVSMHLLFRADLACVRELGNCTSWGRLYCLRPAVRGHAAGLNWAAARKKPTKPRIRTTGQHENAIACGCVERLITRYH
jgi:hypothetical protein